MATKLAFTTLRDDQGFPLFWKSHWQRLLKSWQHFDLPGEPNQSNLLCEVCDLLKQKPNSILRIDLLSTGEFELSPRPLSCHDDEPNLKLKIASTKQTNRDAPSWLKFGDYTRRLNEREQIRKQGFDDFLYLDQESYVAEATVSNIIWVKSDQIFSPKPSKYILHGITVNLILSTLKQSSHVDQFTMEDLYQADAAWLVNAATGPQRISSIDEHKFNSKAPQLDLDQIYWQLVKVDRKDRFEKADHH